MYHVYMYINKYTIVLKLYYTSLFSNILYYCTKTYYYLTIFIYYIHMGAVLFLANFVLLSDSSVPHTADC